MIVGISAPFAPIVEPSNSDSIWVRRRPEPNRQPTGTHVRITRRVDHQCGTAKPSGVVNVKNGLAIDVSGAVGAVDCVTVAPVCMEPIA